MASGADLLARALTRGGITHVFGLPGTQTVPMFDGFRRSSLQTVLATHELNAAFMAAGFFRACGRPAAVASIAGPGFTHTLSGLVEARHDSTGLVHVVGAPASGPGRRFRLQAVDQATIGRLETKGVFEVESFTSIDQTVRDALACAVTGEPGPVVLQVASHVLLASGQESLAVVPEGPPVERSNPGLVAAGDVLTRARRPVLLVGQGALAAADDVREFAELLGAPVVTSCSGRGLIPEDHPLALGFDGLASSVDLLNQLLDTADCILVLGYKLTHNGTCGFKMRLRADALVHVDAEEAVLGANYPVAQPVVADAGYAARYLRSRVADAPRGAQWAAEEIVSWRDRLSTAPGDDTPEPVVRGASPATARGFFSLLRQALPRDAIVVTDSGLHQILVRRHYRVLSPRGLIVPSDYQSMGFGVPAAIGAKLGAPTRPVVAVVGDGGFAMTGMELLTAVREQIPLTVIVFNDGHLNLIRVQQQGASGRSSAVRLQNPDFEAMARALGAEYRLFEGSESFSGLGGLDRPGVTLMEVRLGDSTAMRVHHARGVAGAVGRRVLGPRFTQAVRRWIGRS